MADPLGLCRRGRAVAAGAPRRRTWGARGGRRACVCVCERRAAAAGWQVPTEPTVPRLNSPVLLGFFRLGPAWTSAGKRAFHTGKV